MKCLTLRWFYFGEYDNFNIYRSETPISETNKGENIGSTTKLFFTDYSIKLDTLYYYMIETNADGKTYTGSVFRAIASESLTGIWAVTKSKKLETNADTSYEISDTNNSTWMENFGKTSNIAITSYINVNMQKSPVASGIINAIVSNKNFIIYANAGCWQYDKVSGDFEFLDNDLNCIFALRIAPAGDYTYSSRLFYGSNLNNLIEAQPSGSYPNTNGKLFFDSQGQVTYTPFSTDYNMKAFSHSCDVNKITKCRVSNLYSQNSYDSCATILYLKMLDDTI